MKIKLFLALNIIVSCATLFGMEKVVNKSNTVNKVFYQETDDFKGYHTELPNGDTITASFFLTGSCKGRYYSSRTIMPHKCMLSNSCASFVFHQLKNAYDAQQEDLRKADVD